MNLRLIWLLAVLVFLICLIGLDSSCSKTSAPGRTAATDVEVLKRMTAFMGGKFDASGVAAVPGSEGVLFVYNNEEDQVFWMRLDQYGKQVGAITPVELGVSIEDLEGITTDGTYFYVGQFSSQIEGKRQRRAC